MNENDFNVFASFLSMSSFPFFQCLCFRTEFYVCTNSTFGMDGSLLVVVTFYEETFSKLYVTGNFHPRITWFHSYSSRTSVSLSLFYFSFLLSSRKFLGEKIFLTFSTEKNVLLMKLPVPLFAQFSMCQHCFETYTQLYPDEHKRSFRKGVKSEARKTNGRRRKGSEKTSEQKQY